MLKAVNTRIGTTIRARQECFLPPDYVPVGEMDVRELLFLVLEKLEAMERDLEAVREKAAPLSWES